MTAGSLLFVFAVVLIVLKGAGVIAWPWLWVLAPLWIPIALWLVVIGFVGLAVMIKGIFS